MTASGDLATAKRIWDQQSVWSQAANAAKRTIDQARMVSLLLGIGAAVLGTAGAQLMAWSTVAGRAMAFLSAAAAGLAPLPQPEHGRPQ